MTNTNLVDATENIRAAGPERRRASNQDAGVQDEGAAFAISWNLRRIKHQSEKIAAGV